MCDNHRECEAARRQGFGAARRGSGGRHGLEWHGEWRGQELVRTLIDGLGVELTVTDADDRIVAFSGGPRMFARDDSLLGTSVFGCHPAGSREAVREVLDALRAGEDERRLTAPQPDGSSAEVIFLPRRDAEGVYLGCIELVRRVR